MPAQQDRQFPIKQAEEWYKQAQAYSQQSHVPIEDAFETLRKAFEILADESALEANQIRLRSGELWLLLAEKIAQLETARDVLVEGQQRLALTPLVKPFEVKLSLVETGLQVRHDLEEIPEQDWNEKLEKEGHKWLQGLADDLELLSGKNSWGVLQDRAEGWRQRLTTSLLPAYLEPYDQAARQQSRDGNFEGAFQIADAACQRIPESLSQELPVEIGSQGLWQLREALARRLQIENNLLGAARQLRDKRSSFEAILAEIDLNLVEHPDLPQDDLHSLLNDLKLAAELEVALAKQPSVDGFASSIRDYQDLAKRELSIRDELPAFLLEVDPQSAQDLQARMVALQEDLALKPNDVLLAMSKRIQMETQFIWPDSDPAPLLSITWQLRWCLASEVTNDPDVLETAQAALTRAQKGPRLLLKQALGIFYGLRRHTDVIYLQDILNALIKLNNELSHPSLHREPLASLLPLPMGKTLDAKDPGLDEEALQVWAQILASWHKILLENLPFTQTATYEPVLVKQAGEQFQKFSQDLERLKKEVWPKLQIDPWAEGTSTANLEKELGLRILQVNALQKAGSCLLYRTPMDCMDRLDELTPIMEKTDPYGPSILDAQSQYLKASVADLHRKAREKLNNQVANILQDETGPAKRLQDEILTRTRSKEIAEAVYLAAYNSADQFSAMMLQAGGRDKSNDLWNVILEATQPWAKPYAAEFSLNPDVADQWERLHEAAQKAYRKFPTINLKKLNGTIVGVLFILFVVWFGSKAWSFRTREQVHQAALVIMATATKEAALTQTYQVEVALQKAATGTAEAQLLATQQYALAQINAQQTAVQVTAQAQANAKATAAYETAAALAPTATALNLALSASATAAACGEPSQFALNLLSNPVYYPPPGTRYIVGNAPFAATASWLVENTGECEWKQLSIESLQDSQPISYTLSQDGQPVEITPENPLDVGEQVTVVLDLGVLKFVNVKQEFMFVANGLTLIDQPHLQIDVEDWIVPITPRPTAGRERSNPRPPASTPKPPSRDSSTATSPPR